MRFSTADEMGLSAVPRRPEKDHASDDLRALIAPSLARAIVAVVFCGFGGTALLWVNASQHSPLEMTLAVTILAALLGLQYFYFCRPGTHLHSALSYVVLVVQACLVYLPLAVFHQSWVSQTPFLAAGVLLVFRPSVAWVAFAGIIAGTGVVQYVINGVLLDVVYVAVNAATVALTIYGLVALARLVTALYEARDELAKATVARERLRLTQDVHDLLGASLSAIAPKGELVLRLLRRRPDQAGQELSEILEISRRALDDLRSIARAYREISLGDEAATLATMLAASDVEVRMDLDSRDVVPRMRGTLAAVLREGVAHVLLHPQVRQCEIILRQRHDSITIDILHDGLGPVAAGSGGGRDDLAATVSRLRGELTDTAAGDRSRLHIVLPVPAQAESTPADMTDEIKTSMPNIEPKLASGLVVAVFCGLFVQAVLRQFYVTQTQADVPAAVWTPLLVTAYLLTALVLQLAYFSRPRIKLRPATMYPLLALQALLVYLPILQFQQWQVGLQGFLAASALLVLRPAIGWSVFAAVIGVDIWAQLTFSNDLPLDFSYVIVTVDLALITYGLTWMVRSVRQSQAARLELAEVALGEVRLRFAQDLHDLLGLSLSAITLKADLARRLLSRDLARARGVLEDMLQICRRALADARSVASDHREMSLEEECRTAESLLASADLDVRMDVGHPPLPTDVATVLATVLREGVTNVLRHSKGLQCDIMIRADEHGVCLRITNDGATELADADSAGSGIRNMTDRVVAMGGTLTAEPGTEGRFELTVRIPQSAVSGKGTTSGEHALEDVL
ncbi:sensor histidine kinase [Nonomuraea sp. NPDC002799]